MIFELVLISLVNKCKALFLNGAEEVFVRCNCTIKGISPVVALGHYVVDSISARHVQLHWYTVKTFVTKVLYPKFVVHLIGNIVTILKTHWWFGFIKEFNRIPVAQVLRNLILFVGLEAISFVATHTFKNVGK